MATIISDEYIKQILPTGKQYCIFIFKPGPDRDQPDAEQIQWQHVRYLFQLREDGKLSISCPVTDGSDVLGIGILNTSDLKEAKTILDNDPNVKKGRLIYEMHTCFGLPGDCLSK